ncbi:type II secretion system protein N [Photobacterium kishitanii]|uniref:Type II secretion system protein N n=1 Tax=Photobacterium kishitanii TaxID=318456 RepID=A0A2T3KAB5_9GAMM|nr:type II secretion system protein N [Photobacterium kishitanii]PSU88340.1 general secretion pathway protein GspN [Photobacterium kishitanii]
MKFKLAVGASFGAVFIASLVAHIPASWVWQHAPKINGLALEGITGTPWQGTAVNVRWQNQTFGRLHWDMRLGRLLHGELAFDVRFGQGSEWQLQGQGLVGYSSAGPFAEKLLLSMPAAQAVSQAQLPVPITVKGNLELTVRDYHYAAPYCKTLDATLAWVQGAAETPMGTIKPGPVFADLNCANGAVVAKIKQASDDVSSDWQANLATNQQYKLQGWFKPGAQFPAELAKQLKWLGEPNTKGQYKLNYSGRL